MKSIILVIGLLFSIGYSQTIDTLNTRYTLPRVRFTQLENQNCIIQIEKILAYQDGKVKTYVYKANNITENEEFKCILIELPESPWGGIYAQTIELTKSEAEGLAKAIEWGRNNFFAKVGLFYREFTYSGRYFRLAGFWSPDKPGDMSMKGKTGAVLYKKSVSLGEHVVKEDYMNFSQKDIFALEKALKEAISKY